MPDNHDDLLYFAHQIARSVRRRDGMLELETPGANLVLQREEKILATRRRRLELLVEAARVTDDLPPKDDLLGLLGRFAGEMTEEHAERVLAAGVLLEAAYPEPVPVQPHNSITAQPIKRFQTGQ